MSNNSNFLTGRGRLGRTGCGGNSAAPERRSPAALPRNFLGGTLPAAGRRAEISLSFFEFF